MDEKVLASINKLTGEELMTLDAFRLMKKAFQQTFTSPSGQQVLHYLAPFCRASTSTAVPGNHDATFILEGRREVWLLIQNFLNLTPTELAAIMKRQIIKLETSNDGDDHGR